MKNVKKINLISKLINFNATYIVGDISKTDIWKKINNLATFKNKLFTAFEVIEHVHNDELFWSSIRNYHHDILILSLPIGDKIPSHIRYFKSLSEVKNYLKKSFEKSLI